MSEYEPYVCGVIGANGPDFRGQTIAPYTKKDE